MAHNQLMSSSPNNNIHTNTFTLNIKEQFYNTASSFLHNQNIILGVQIICTFHIQVINKANQDRENYPFMPKTEKTEIEVSLN